MGIFVCTAPTTRMDHLGFLWSLHEIHGMERKDVFLLTLGKCISQEQ